MENKTVDLNNIQKEQIINKEINSTTEQEQNFNKEKRIDLYNLVKEYNKRSSTKTKKEFLKAIIKINPYINYGAKLVLAEGIIKTSCLKDGNVYIDSCKKYMLYIYTLLKQYTNIDISEKDLLLQYDLLDKFGLVEEILELIPEKEIVTFKTILDMKQSDLMTNKYGTYAFINDQIERVKTISPEVSKAFAPLIETLNKKIENLDENKIEKMLNKITMASKFIK